MAPESKPKFTIWNDEENQPEEAVKHDVNTPVFSLRRANTLPSRKHPRDWVQDQESSLKRRKSTSDLRTVTEKTKAFKTSLKSFHSTIGRVKSKRFTFNRKVKHEQNIVKDIAEKPLDEIPKFEQNNTPQGGDNENDIEKQIKILLSYCSDKNSEPEPSPKVQEPKTEVEEQDEEDKEVKKLVQLCRSPKKRVFGRNLNNDVTSQRKKLTFSFKCGEKTLVIRKKHRVSLWRRVIMKQHHKTCRDYLRTQYGLDV